ncbi:MAG: polysulfide reductase NrfD [Dehalococcoidales bacterium]|nr:polysulfide reductase NrfD [Dehalococcoidales bacterium]
MIDKALSGSGKYWGWLLCLVAVIGVGFACYLWQLNVGLGITGMSRDVSWGFYIAQFTFLVGVAASAVMLVLPYYLHHYKAFARITIMGEFLAVAAVLMCMLFIGVDMGRPDRLLNMLLYPTPNSVMLWDFMALSGYLLLNITIGWTMLTAESKEVPPPSWVKPLIYLSIPWAVSIHTVTAFLYAGLPGREFWLTAIMAPRFLASAFASGPSLLIILGLILRRFAGFDPGKEALQKLATIVTYAMTINVFFVLMEFFTGFYSQVPGHMESLTFLFFGLDGYSPLVPFMWLSAVLGIGAVAALIVPSVRRNERTLLLAAIAIFVATWIDKGLGLVVGGFTPSPLGYITTYTPTVPELLISLGVYGIGFFVLTVLYKIAIGVKQQEAEGEEPEGHAVATETRIGKAVA